jgi:hypothetical protein
MVKLWPATLLCTTAVVLTVMTHNCEQEQQATTTTAMGNDDVRATLATQIQQQHPTIDTDAVRHILLSVRRFCHFIYSSLPDWRPSLAWITIEPCPQPNRTESTVRHACATTGGDWPTKKEIARPTASTTATHSTTADAHGATWQTHHGRLRTGDNVTWTQCRQFSRCWTVIYLTDYMQINIRVE